MSVSPVTGFFLHSDSRGIWGVLASRAGAIDSHELSGLKTTHVYSLTFGGWKPQMSFSGLPIKMCAGPSFPPFSSLWRPPESGLQASSPTFKAHLSHLLASHTPRLTCTFTILLTVPGVRDQGMGICGGPLFLVGGSGRWRRPQWCWQLTAPSGSSSRSCSVYSVMCQEGEWLVFPPGFPQLVSACHSCCVTLEQLVT